MIETVEVNLSRYLQGPGTGTTNLPSFSAIKFSVVLVELPLSSFFSITITSFFVDLRLRQTFPPLRESCGAVAFFHVVWRQIHQVDLGNFVARSTRLHHLVKTNNHRVCARRIKDRLQCRAVIGLEGGFVSLDECFLLFCVGGTRAKARNDHERCD
jgi:hypothetical protein